MKLYMYSFLLVTVIVLIILANVAKATVISELSVKVYKNNQPVVNAVIEIWNTTLVSRAETNASGIAMFHNISSGNYTIYVYYNGSVWRFNKEINVNTTVIVLNITDPGWKEVIIGLDEPFMPNITYSPDQILIRINPILFYTGIGVLLIIILLLVYAFSGKKIPKRR